MAAWLSLLLPDHSPPLLHNPPALNLMSPENSACYSSCCNCGSLGSQLTVLVPSATLVTVLGNTAVHREGPSSTTQVSGFPSHDPVFLHTSDTHSCGFTLDLVFAINWRPSRIHIRTAHVLITTSHRFSLQSRLLLLGIPDL